MASCEHLSSELMQWTCQPFRINIDNFRFPLEMGLPLWLIFPYSGGGNEQYGGALAQAGIPSHPIRHTDPAPGEQRYAERIIRGVRVVIVR